MKEKIVKILNLIIEGCLIGAILLIPIFFDFLKLIFDTFIFPKQALFEILVLLALLAWTGRFFLLGKVTFRFKPKFIIMPVILAGCFLLSAWFSIHPIESFWGNHFRQQGALSFIFYLLFFVLLCLELDSWQKIKRLLWAALFSSAIVCLYGIAQFFYLDPLSWNEDFSVNGRIFSTIGQPNFLGHYLIIVIPLTLYSLFFLVRRFVPRFFIILLLGSQLFCLFYTLSRSAWLGFLAEIWLIILISLIIKGWKKIAKIFVIFSLLGIILVSLIGLNSSSEFVSRYEFLNRVTSVFDINHGSAKLRLEYWQAAYLEIKNSNLERKLIGYGPDATSDIFVKYYQPDWSIYEKINTWPDRAHNLFFDNLLQFGIVGTLAIFIFFGWLIFKAGKVLFMEKINNQERWLLVVIFASLIGYFVNNLFSFSEATHDIYLYFLLAILTHFIYKSREKQETKIFFNKFSLLIIFIFLAFFSVVFIFIYNLRPLEADYYYMRAMKQEPDSSCTATLGNLKKAVVASSGYDNFYKGLLIGSSSGCFETAVNDEQKNNLKENIAWYLASIPEKEKEFFLKKQELYTEIDVFANFQKAEEISSFMLREYPGLEESYRDRAYLLLKEKNFNESLEYIQKAKDHSPLYFMDNPAFPDKHLQALKVELAKLYEMEAKNYLGIKKDDLAIEAYLNLLKVQPDRLAVYKSIADIYYSQNNIEKALWYNKKGYSLNPKDYSWPLAISLLLKEKGDYKEALIYTEQALKLAPDNADLRNTISDLKKCF